MLFKDVEEKFVKLFVFLDLIQTFRIIPSNQFYESILDHKNPFEEYTNSASNNYFLQKCELTDV